jgi:hypothetical protein
VGSAHHSASTDTNRNYPIWIQPGCSGGQRECAPKTARPPRSTLILVARMDYNFLHHEGNISYVTARELWTYVHLLSRGLFEHGERPWQTSPFVPCTGEPVGVIQCKKIEWRSHAYRRLHNVQWFVLLAEMLERMCTAACRLFVV